MLPYLSRVSLWLAALAAAASLFTSGSSGATLASVAMVSLIGALVFRRWEIKARVVSMPELEQAATFDEAALCEAAAMLLRSIVQSKSLHDALTRVGDELVHEIGAHGLTVHESPAGPLVVANRFPLGHAAHRDEVAGTPEAGFALPVSRKSTVVAMIEMSGTALDIDPPALIRLLGMIKPALDALAVRDAGPGGTADGEQVGVAPQAPGFANPDGQNDDQNGSDGRLFTALADHLPVSLFVFEPVQLRLLALNRQAESEFALERTAMIGRTLHQAFHPHLAALAEPAMRRAIHDGMTVEIDCEWNTHGGVGSTVNLRNVVLRHADGRPRLLITVASDVTIARRDQRELEESQARYNELSETMDDTLFVSDLDRTHFDFLGASAFATFGITREQFNLRHAAVLDHVIEEDSPLLQDRRDMEARGEPADITYRIDHPHKGLRWMRSRSRTRRLPDGAMRVYGLVSDVTGEREHAVELERARDAAEAASRAKSQFMANMSHEIRTPMNGILGMTELLLGTPLNEKQRRFATAVYRSGESLLEIINDILDFSKIEAGKLELAPIEFTLRAIVEDTLELLAPRAHEKGLELNYHEGPGVPAAVRGDAMRLRQVLTNLVANAIKFTERGEVVVDVCCLKAASGLRLCFTVRDTGIGIEPEVLPRLFSAFTQAHGGMSRRYGGTGLGLAISKQLIELMGGDIVVRSQPGNGSQFAFELPFTAASGMLPSHELDERDLSDLRVLVVEDHETNRTVLENMLGAWGVDVTLAEDGQQALDILRGKTVFDTHYDLALVDMDMPRVDGLTFGQTLKADGSHPELKLILLSSVSSPDDVRSAQLAGFHRFVAKPVRKAELRQAIVGVSALRRDSAPVPPPPLDGHVLVIEDNPVNQEVVGQMLRHFGLRVRMASSALQGLRALCEAHFDLILMDIQMPGMDGVQALDWFRRRKDGRFEFVTPSHTPVIAVTANALGGDQDRFLALGFDDYLSKPFRQSQLLSMLTKHLRLRSGIDGDHRPEAGGDAAVGGPAPTPAQPDAVLDQEALARLRELDPHGENQLLSRVVSAFEKSAARLMPQLQDAHRSGDLAGVRHVAHTLKSSSASIGAMKLSHLCAEIELKIRTNHPEKLDGRVDSMCAEVQIVLQALQRLLDPKP